MSATGRYTMCLPNGRKLTVEPIKERVERALDWTNGGIVKPTGGAVPPEASIITEANGYKNIQIVQNPQDVVDRMMREDGLL